MKERPILMSIPMVQAILAGNKTMTRRIIKYNKEINNPDIGFTVFSYPDKFSVRGVHENGQYGESIFRCPYLIGDRLWVRETWCRIFGTPAIYEYKATPFHSLTNPFIKWCPSIHMPRAASRITLEITNVRVERLQDITEEDAHEEGCEGYISEKWGGVSGVREFSELWQSINGPESWDLNPWVWVIEFKVIQPARG